MCMFSPTLSYLFSFLLVATLLFFFVHFVVRRFWDKKGHISATLCLIIALVCVFSVLWISFCAPDIFSMYPLGSSESANSSGTIYNLMSPFIAILAAILTFMAFWVQFNANQEMLKNSAKQQLERQFYEMLKIHKYNVNEIKWENWSIQSSQIDNIDNLKKGPVWNNRYSIHSEYGRKVFDCHLQEFEFVYFSLGVALGSLKKKENVKMPENFKELSKWKEMISTAYYIYIKGMSVIKYEMFKCDEQADFFKLCDENPDELKDLITQDGSIKDRVKGITSRDKRLFFNFDSDGYAFLYLYFLLSFFKKQLRPFEYDGDVPLFQTLRGAELFKGHFSELNHYYRHLYQMVKMVANYGKDIVAYHEKRKYLKMLRAQLTSNEQCLLFFNWLAGQEFGEDWENDKNHFFTEYRMIHNFRPKEIFVFENIDVNDLIKMIKDKNPKYDKYDGDPLFEFENFRE